MKRLVFGFAALVAISGVSLAGTETYTAPAGKESKQVETPSCFSDSEWQADVFGAYQVGNGPNHAGPIKDHGWGGGVAVNYFFARYFGLSAEGSWLEGHSNAATGKSGGDQFQSAVGNLIFRYPIDSWCIAPYVFLGGGATMDGSAWAVGDVGVGLEYRIIPNKLGIFADGRWNYYGDRYEHDTQNNFMVRVGTRLVF
ncbi:MAG: outer membrane beta-barrel protein [Chthoniobacteraceae bacterium]|jgi:hypothetical protein